MSLVRGSIFCFILLILIMPTSAFAGGSAKQIIVIEKIEIETSPGGDEFLILQENKSQYGTGYFLTFRRGGNFFSEILLNQKDFSLWRDKFNSLLFKRNISQVCSRSLAVHHNRLGHKKDVVFCLDNKKNNLALSKLITNITHHYRQNSGWEK